jgi:hypothetical protein
VGFLAPAEATPEYRVVGTAMGTARKLSAEGAVLEQWSKARMFVLESLEVVLVVPAGPGAVDRVVGTTVASEWNRQSRQLTAVLESGEILTVNGQGCGCNMGAVGNAGPSDGQYRLVKVRRPEWHTVTG